MRKDVIGIRLDASEKEALERAARADERSMSFFARKIIADWLRANGFLLEAKRAKQRPE
jgi:uncharacterized protein (DUF1778 family)